jgi:GTPase SAR1 family protein
MQNAMHSLLLLSTKKMVTCWHDNHYTQITDITLNSLKERLIMKEQELQQEIQKKVTENLEPLFARYQLDMHSLSAVLKWKPIVLILGNYSSGKSTLINEILGQDVQRTGQAPTDDAFTVISAPPKDEEPRIVPGATLVNDDAMPFTSFKSYGEQFVTHFRMKQIASPLLGDLAIIDSPGMLDSVTERDRGYDYLGVIADLISLADLVVLMFDPHKAGTIKETYTTIRDTLPQTSREDRVVFVMSRIDECDNLGDLVRSYGTLCWNLSQMTGRKDIPWIYMTFSENAAEKPGSLEIWAEERKQLKRKIMDAPKLRISHILQNVEKQVGDLKMVAEAMAKFGKDSRRLLGQSSSIGFGVGLFFFFFLDVILRELFNVPPETLLSALFSGGIQLKHLIVPLTGLLASLLLAAILHEKWRFPSFIKDCQKNIDRLVNLDTTHSEHTWARVKGKVKVLIGNAGLRDLLPTHHNNVGKIDKFIKKELQSYYTSIR